MARDLSGIRFGRLIVLEHDGYRARGKKRISVWRCRCDCGSERTLRGEDLRSGNTQSCGCLHREQLQARVLRHGLHKTPIYRVWSTMKERCQNPNNEKYPNYGGRGIRVCERWQSFENFYADMGPRPSPKHSIDRIEKVWIGSALVIFNS